MVLNVLDHVMDAAASLRVALNLLRPGGYFVFGQDLSDVDRLVGKYEWFDEGHPIRLRLGDLDPFLGELQPVLRKVSRARNLETHDCRPESSSSLDESRRLPRRTLPPTADTGFFRYEVLRDPVWRPRASQGSARGSAGGSDGAGAAPRLRRPCSGARGAPRSHVALEHRERCRVLQRPEPGPRAEVPEAIADVVCRATLSGPAHRGTAVALPHAAMMVEAQAGHDPRRPADGRGPQLVDEVHHARNGVVERKDSLEAFPAPRPDGPAHVRAGHVGRPPFAVLQLEALAAGDPQGRIGGKRSEQLLEVIGIHRYVGIQLHDHVDRRELGETSVKGTDDRPPRGCATLPGGLELT